MAKLMPKQATSRMKAEGAPAVTVSIVVVNYNGAGLLRDCLGSLEANCGSDVEVMLVDNGSTDGSLEIVSEFPWVNVVRSEKNLGFTGGNNLGLAQTSGKYVLLLNNDTIVTPGFLQPLCEYLDRNPQVGIVQGKMVLPRYGNTLDVCGSFFTSLGLPYHYGYFKPDGPRYRRSYPVFSAKGACLLFRREMIPQIGGFLFDEDFFCYYEEADFCHRAWLAGYEVHFVPSPPIQHLMGATGERVLKHDLVQRYYLRNMMFSLLSNLSPSYRWRILPVFFGVLLFRMLVFLLTFQRAPLAAHWGAFSHCAAHWGKIRARRRLIRQIRRKPDQEIFGKVLRTPRLDYFVKTFRGRIAEFEDPEIT